MFANRTQINKWKYLSKFSYFSGLISITLGLISIIFTIIFWVFPDNGKQLLDSIISKPQNTGLIPGNNIIEKQINRAKIEGVTAPEASTEFVVAVPFVRPSLTAQNTNSSFGEDTVGFSNASPLRYEDQDIVFAPGKCRFLGSVDWSQQPILKGQSGITVISCVLDNGDVYSFGDINGPKIGFVTSIEHPANKELNLIREDKSVTLPLNERYLVRFLTPIHELVFKGKSSVSW